MFHHWYECLVVCVDLVVVGVFQEEIKIFIDKGERGRARKKKTEIQGKAIKYVANLTQKESSTGSIVTSTFITKLTILSVNHLSFIFSIRM